MPKDYPRPSPTRNVQMNREDIDFAHPSEQEFARILDFYGIEWLYEPMTYPLRWDKQGRVIEAFSPDFYLVEQDLFIELTTLRQKLIRFKNRKIRRLRELYPDVRIQLWTRRDFTRFLERCGIDDRSSELVGKEAMED
jgi:hypothetical protein